MYKWTNAAPGKIIFFIIFRFSDFFIIIIYSIITDRLFFKIKRLGRIFEGPFFENYNVHLFAYILPNYKNLLIKLWK